MTSPRRVGLPARASERAGMVEAERRERLTQIVLRRSKLSPDEAARLREVFPEIVAAHHDQVWNLLRKRGLDSHEAEDLLQEVFLALHNPILENGFVANLPGMLHALTHGKVLNHARPEALPVLPRPALVGLREAEEPARRRTRPACAGGGAAHLLPALAGASGGDRQDRLERPHAH